MKFDGVSGTGDSSMKTYTYSDFTARVGTDISEDVKSVFTEYARTDNDNNPETLTINTNQWERLIRTAIRTPARVSLEKFIKSLNNLDDDIKTSLKAELHSIINGEFSSELDYQNEIRSFKIKLENLRLEHKAEQNEKNEQFRENHPTLSKIKDFFANIFI